MNFLSNADSKIRPRVTSENLRTIKFVSSHDLITSIVLVADFTVSQKIVEAAKLQRMNTDVRRKIFYSVMGADDYVDAFQKIMKCNLKVDIGVVFASACVFPICSTNSGQAAEGNRQRCSRLLSARKVLQSLLHASAESILSV